MAGRDQLELTIFSFGIEANEFASQGADCTANTCEISVQVFFLLNYYDGWILF